MPQAIDKAMWSQRLDDTVLIFCDGANVGVVTHRFVYHGAQLLHVFGWEKLEGDEKKPKHKTKHKTKKKEARPEAPAPVSGEVPQ